MLKSGRPRESVIYCLCSLPAVPGILSVPEGTEIPVMSLILLPEGLFGEHRVGQ